MTRGQILIVDDNPANVLLLRALLEHHGYAVATAGSAYEALDVLGQITPQLVLMDLQMPGMDGYELTRRLKTDPATAAIVILAVTAYAMKGDEERARAAGCDGYVTKPIDTRGLPVTIATLLARVAS